METMSVNDAIIRARNDLEQLSVSGKNNVAHLADAMDILDNVINWAAGLKNNDAPEVEVGLEEANG